jgi:hypothetical protein
VCTREEKNTNKKTLCGKEALHKKPMKKKKITTKKNTGKKRHPPWTLSFPVSQPAGLEEPELIHETADVVGTYGVLVLGDTHEGPPVVLPLHHDLEK